MESLEPINCQNVFKNLRSKGVSRKRMSRRAAQKESKDGVAKRPDVNFKVVKQFVKSVEERAIGADSSERIESRQWCQDRHEEMISLMGFDTTEITLQPASPMTSL